MKKETMLLIFGVLILMSGFSLAFYGRLTGSYVFFGYGFLLIITSTAPTVASIIMKPEAQKPSLESYLGLWLVIVGGAMLLLAFWTFYYSEMVF